MRARDKVSNRKIVREAIRRPLKDAGFGPVWGGAPLLMPILRVYRPLGQREVTVEDFDGQIIVNLGAGSYALEGPPTGAWLRSDLEVACARMRALLAWWADPSEEFPEGWRPAEISFRGLSQP